MRTLASFLIMLTGVTFLSALSPSRAGAQGSSLPRDGGQIDVKVDYGAVCDGISDDTHAFLRAIEGARSNRHRGKHVIFVPAGTCLISDQLPWRESSDAGGSWQQHLSLLGAGRDRSFIRLIDHAPGFQDPNQPRAMLYTASKVEPADPPSRKIDGSGNRAFHNHISDLTLDVGRDDPGAVGIDFLANNVGSVRNVRIRSTSRTGFAGILMERYGPGPSLLSHVVIEGFDYGIRIAHFDYGITLEHVHLSQQNVAGIYNLNNTLSIRKLSSANTVRVIDNAGSNGLIVLIDSLFQGGSTARSAIRNNGKLLLRNVRATGYGSVLSQLSGGFVSEYVSHGPYRAFGQNSPTTLSLPIEETPTGFYTTRQSDWANVIKYGAVPWDEVDDSDAFQAAMDSGKPIVYSPTGAYHFSKSIRIPASVRLLHGNGSTFQPTTGVFEDPNASADFFVVEQSASTPLTLLRFWAAGFNGANVLRQASQRVLVVKDAGFGGVGRIKVDASAGKVFLEDVSVGTLDIGMGSRVWARQLNLEARALPEMSNNAGGVLWVLGIKTEMAKTVNHTRDGGCTEILGGLIYPVYPVHPELPMFIVSNASASFSYAETAYSEERRHMLHIEETRAQVQERVLRTALPPRGLGSVMTLGSSHAGACSQLR